MNQILFTPGGVFAPVNLLFNMEKIIINVWLVSGFYVCVFIAVLADLWSGVRKAKQNGIARSSYGFKRTVDKVARYYNVLLALTVVDVLIMASILYLNQGEGYSLPLFPVFSLLGALGLCLIEVKSIYEKAEDKVRLENVVTFAGQVYTHKDDINAIAKAVADFMSKPDKPDTPEAPQK